MPEIIFTDNQFYVVLMFVIWAYVSSLAYEKDDIPLMWIQLVIAFPLFIFLLADAFLQGHTLGYGVGFGILCTSAYIATLATSRSKTKN